MTAEDMLDLVNELFFSGLALLTLLNFIRYRDVTRRDVALLFGLLGLPFIETLISRISGQPMPSWASVVGVVALFIEPYALLRVVNYLHPIPPIVMNVTLIGMLVANLTVIVFGNKPPAIAVLPLQLYFVGLNVYAAFGFVRGALKLQGVLRQRMRFAALGAALFAAVLVALFVSRGGNPFLITMAELLAIASATMFYLGFTPPRWLRRMWQLDEMSNYLSLMSSKPLDARLSISDIMRDLCSATNRTVGGMASGIVRREAADQPWTVTYVDEPAQTALQATDSFKSIWDQASLTIIHAAKAQGDQQRLLSAVGAHTLLMAPITTLEGVWGVLLVFLRNASLFVEDDLHFMMVLAQQNAIFLANSTLIQELRKLNVELEAKAVQLSVSNRELESFSYSVSHDLRAPLRALDGFSQALTEDYADKLDDTGKRYLDRLRTNSHRMEQLIDDLIELAQWTRIELRHEQVSLTTLARYVIAELQEQHPDRKVNIEVEDGIIVGGDTRLLRVVMQNLLGNAWKYTAKQPNANIKFGMIEREGNCTYYVRDNGAGFDMAYADKLFGAFQRLHNADEFPGSGIGLATVQRIIHRHGGNIWAESAVGQGATFHFSL
jgi:signal transduction histidine kinase